jgi:hypothetical protein
MKYKITDHEIDKVTEVEAPGIIEAMLEYLTWPTLQLTVDYHPTYGSARVMDEVTDFIYDVEF